MKSDELCSTFEQMVASFEKLPITDETSVHNIDLQELEQLKAEIISGFRRYNPCDDVDLQRVFLKEEPALTFLMNLIAKIAVTQNLPEQEQHLPSDTMYYGLVFIDFIRGVLGDDRPE